jgi:hypothetical protein
MQTESTSACTLPVAAALAGQAGVAVLAIKASCSGSRLADTRPFFLCKPPPRIEPQKGRSKKRRATNNCSIVFPAAAA